MKRTKEAPVSNSNVFVTSEVKPWADVSNLPARKGIDAVVVSNGKIVNVVSDSYGHLPNEDFFAKAEMAIIDAGLKYKTKAVNRDDRQFAVDYILDDESYEIKIKGGGAMKGQNPDTLKPMLRFVNSYDGMSKASGSFGFHRRVCTNGLMVSTEIVGFKVVHKGLIAEVAIPQIEPLIKRFMDNEFYALSKKFEVLAERAIPANKLHLWVKNVAKVTGLFTYEASEKNPEPSLNARMVLETISRESSALGVPPNYWLGYNAFNEVLHGKLKKSFDKQKSLDAKLFDTIVDDTRGRLLTEFELN